MVKLLLWAKNDYLINEKSESHRKGFVKYELNEFAYKIDVK